MSRVGRLISARAMAHIWRSPPDSLPASWSCRSRNTGKLAVTSSIRSRTTRAPAE